VAACVSADLKAVQDLLRTTRDSLVERNRQLADSVFVALNDPRHPLVPPPREAPPPFLNLAPLENASARLTAAADRFEAAYATAMRQEGEGLGRERAEALNALLLQAEHALAPDAGLPRRPWYKQLLAAPGWYTGYAPKSLPGVREAIEARRWSEAETQAATLARALVAEAELLEQAAHGLDGSDGRT
jgi:N-acetylated-alpha-linked acidic dipeptidase